MDTFEKKLNQSLEKIVIIGLNLTLLVTIGIPLLFTTTDVLSQSEHVIEFQQFVQELDELILTNEQEQSFQTAQIIVPPNLTLEAVNNQLIFKVYIQDWHILTRTYRHSLQVIGPIYAGHNQVSINATDLAILISFQKL